MVSKNSMLADIISKYQDELLADWMKEQLAATTMRRDLLSEKELRTQSQDFLAAFAEAIARSGGSNDPAGPAWAKARELLNNVSVTRAEQGFSPADTATFIFSLKQPLFTRLRKELEQDGVRLADEIWATTILLDKLGLYTTEVHQKSREGIIARQQQELLELSTPVVRLWEGVLAVPLIGTLDSERTQVVMESLLQQIVSTESTMAIIDITGVPTVDTLVAQHLLKTVTATRLMGADCIISGVRPQIAQTLVELGVDLTGVVTKATLAGAFQVALQRVGLSVAKAQRRGAWSRSRS